MAVTQNRNIGNIGENLICEYLIGNGYIIIKRNYTKLCGEIDIIATKGDIIAFVEVKTRKSDSLVSPLEAVTKSKQRKIINTAEIFLTEYAEYQNFQPSFDVGTVTNDNGKFTVDYYENTFSLDI